MVLVIKRISRVDLATVFELVYSRIIGHVVRYLYASRFDAVRSFDLHNIGLWMSRTRLSSNQQSTTSSNLRDQHKALRRVPS
jgi:hypothetical protein